MSHCGEISTGGQTSALYEWEIGDVSGANLVKITEAEAERLIERFREKWGEQV